MKTEISLSRQIAETIHSQIGAGRFMAMTGARVLCIIQNGIAYSLPLDSQYVNDGINRIEIELMPSDTYEMRAYKGSAVSLEHVKTESMVYFDQLESTFTEITGLFTRF
ncbi:hypothetical protein [Aeromonas caviae]|uniref:hypothetical protein n=1 Tax=Aeromonas caviae TaxID=648 RepID=UPI003F7A8FDE